MPVIFSPNSQTKITPASGIRRSFSTPSNSQSAIYMLAGGLMLTSVSGLAQDSGNIVEVGEPAKGRSTYIVPITLSPTTISGWTSLTACTAYGTIMVIADVASPNPATPNVDLVLTKSDYSIRIQPSLNAQNEIVIDVTSDEIIFEVLADSEVESPELVTYGHAEYGIICDDGMTRAVERIGTHGKFIINDTVASPTPDYTIPIRQKSLSSQLNSLRALSLHNATTRDRGIAKEIDRARHSTGLRTDNLQLRHHGQTLSVGNFLGGAAGDSANDFGRWGAFVTGNVDMGKRDKDTHDESEFHSNMLIAGIDYKISKNAVLGAAITHSDVDAGTDETANTDFRRYSLSLFASLYSLDTFYLDMMLTYGTSNYDLDRRIVRDDGGADVGRANTDGDETSVSLGAGYNWHHRNINIRLFSFLNYIDANIEGYRESVNGLSSAAEINGIDLQSFIANLGLELSWNMNMGFGVLTPMISLAQERQYADDSVYVTGRFIGGPDEGDFAYSAPHRDNDYLNAQLGLSAVLKNGVSAYMTYNTFIAREDFSSRQWSFGIRWEY